MAGLGRSLVPPTSRPTSAEEARRDPAAPGPGAGYRSAAYGYGPPVYGYGMASPALPSTNGLAIASLVCSLFFWFYGIGAVLGILWLILVIAVAHSCNNNGGICTLNTTN